MQSSFVERKLTAWLQRQTSVSGVRRVASVGGAIASEIGNIREQNQDRAVIVRGVDAYGVNYAAAVVADGIGGMRDGQQCAALGIASFVSELSRSSKQMQSYPINWFNWSIRAANDAVYSRFRGQGGTTFVAVLIHENRGVIWGSAGDSRLYGFPDKRLRQISVDDTIAGQLGKNGPVPPEHSKILQYVGMGNDFSPHVEQLDEDIGHLLLLTTDGVHYLSENADIFNRILQYAPDAGTAAKRLVDLAKWCGGTDNATISIVSSLAEFNENRLDDTDCLAIWDAFGELQVQLSSEPEQLQYHAANVSNPKKSDIKTQPDEEEQSPAEPPSPDGPNQADPKKEVKSKRRSQKSKKSKTKNSDEVAAPQLDIEFSSKTE